VQKESANSHLEREFPMSDRNFELIANVAYQITGIKLGDHKRNMIYGRLARRIRALGLKSFNEYCALIETEDGPEIHEFVNAITTNLTSFFREPHHFEFLANTVFNDIKRQGNNRRIRGWSAGCSTGEEPYSIAMVTRESMPATGWDIKLLATDLDSNVVAHSKEGIYNADRIAELSSNRQQKWFMRGRAGGQVKVKPSLQELITFKQLNLLHSWPMKGPFDFIFCRNVVIYFDKETQKVLFNRYADLLKPNGYLFIGHSETLHKVSDRFRSLGKTIYQKIR
jgi:chemotaxis protein methyltransferase CheR